MFIHRIVPHVWGSMGKMVARILEQEEAIRRVLSMDRKSASLNLTWQDKDVLQSMNQVLSKLSELTDILSGEKYVTVSSVLPMVELLNNTLLKQCEDDTDLVASMKKAVRDDINPRYIGSGTVTLLKLTSLLDPRFKSKYIEESSLEEIKDKVISEMSAFRPQQQPILASPDTEQPAKKKKQLWEVFLKIIKFRMKMQLSCFCLQNKKFRERLKLILACQG